MIRLTQILKKAESDYDADIMDWSREQLHEFHETYGIKRHELSDDDYNYSSAITYGYDFSKPIKKLSYGERIDIDDDIGKYRDYLFCKLVSLGYQPSKVEELCGIDRVKYSSKARYFIDTKFTYKTCDGLVIETTTTSAMAAKIKAAGLQAPNYTKISTLLKDMEGEYFYYGKYEGTFHKQILARRIVLYDSYGHHLTSLKGINQ